MLDYVFEIAGALVPFLIAFAILVTAHEYGHFLAGKSLGVVPTHFAVGLGKVLWSRRDRDGCEWQLRAVPIGGFVRFLGDRDGTGMVSANDMTDIEKPDPSSPYLLRRPPSHRALVLAAGPAANLLLGFFVIASLYVGFGRPVVPPIVREVVAGGAAEQAGIRPGDRILSVNGVRTHSFGDIFSEISLRLDEPAVARIARGTEELTIQVQPRVERISGIGGIQSIGRIGIVSGDPIHETVGPIDALRYGAGDVWTQTRAFVIAVKQLFIGTRPISEVGGPIKMAEVTSQAIGDGLANFVFIIAAFSINLAVVNLVPLPVLDGGQLLICAIEGAMRRPLNAKLLVGIQAIGVVLLLALMTTLTINDLWALFSKA